MSAAETILISDSDDDEPKVPEPGRHPMRLQLNLGTNADKPIDLTADDEAAWDLQRRIVIDLTSDSIDYARLNAERNARRADAQRAAPNAIDVEATDLLDSLRKKLASHVAHHGLHGHSGYTLNGGGRGQLAPSLPIWSNPKSLPGEPLYERFVKAWKHAPCQRIQLVFHGTSEQNVAAICTDGLDPARRAGQAAGPGEYFGKEMTVSQGYCRGGKHMLIFAVLLEPSGVTYNAGGVVVINKAEHQLPLAVVTMSGAGYTPPPDFARAASKPHGTDRARNNHLVQGQNQDEKKRDEPTAATDKHKGSVQMIDYSWAAVLNDAKRGAAAKWLARANLFDQDTEEDDSGGEEGEEDDDGKETEDDTRVEEGTSTMALLSLSAGGAIDVD